MNVEQAFSPRLRRFQPGMGKMPTPQIIYACYVQMNLDLRLCNGAKPYLGVKAL